MLLLIEADRVAEEAVVVVVLLDVVDVSVSVAVLEAETLGEIVAETLGETLGVTDAVLLGVIVGVLLGVSEQVSALKYKSVSNSCDFLDRQSAKISAYRILLCVIWVLS